MNLDVFSKSKWRGVIGEPKLISATFPTSFSFFIHHKNHVFMDTRIFASVVNIPFLFGCYEIKVILYYVRPDFDRVYEAICRPSLV